MEKTLVILKPDCMAQRRAGNVIGRFEAAGLKLVACKLVRLTLPLLRTHYAHCVDQPYYPRLEAFMAASPVILLVLQGDGSIAKVRELLGPTDSKKAPKGTIRGDFGTDVTINIAHASDGPANAAIEIARFFNADEVFG